MRYYVPHPCDLPKIDLGEFLPRCLIDLPSCLAENFELTVNRAYRFLIGDEPLFVVATEKPLDPLPSKHHL